MLVRLGEHVVKVLHCTELGHDIPVIGDVIAIVIVRGLVNRGEPEYVDTELFQIRQVLRDAVQIADPVSVAVCKAAWINLINDGLFPPGLCFISNFHHSYLHSRPPRQSLILLSCVCYSIILSYSIIPKERKIYLKIDSKLRYFDFFERIRKVSCFCCTEQQAGSRYRRGKSYISLLFHYVVAII